MIPLPVDALIPDILDAFERGRNLVLEAPPGAGKTTRVPPALLRALPGDVLVLEPRRLAARLAARRVAQEMGDTLGRTVGYQVRFEEVAGPETRLRFMTEGVLTRRLLSDPGLSGVSAVVIDEFHERHLEGDLALALVRRLQRTRRPDLRIGVMSATIDAGPVAAFLGAPALRSEGRMFDVAVSWTPSSPDALDQQVAGALDRLLRDALTGDVLVFLPGAAEIRRAARACERLASRADLLVLPLHGDLSPEEQDRAVQPAGKRKLILSTNVAESSVTIEGVTAVIDSGLARVAGRSPWTGLPRLTVSRISKASANQRAGRAGRTAPGRVIRLYSAEEFARRPDHDAPEVQRAEMSQAMLELAIMGVGDLEWLDAPPQSSLATARDLLMRLGALDASGRVTSTGRAMAQMPLHPRLARLVAGAPGDAACRIAAALSTGERLGGTEHASASSDLLALAEAEWEPKTRQVYQQIRRLAPRGRTDETGVLMAVLAAFPDRVAKRRAGNELLLASGGSAVLADTSTVRSGEFMVAVDVEERRERGLPLVRLASAIQADWLLDLFPERIRERVELDWNRKAERVEEIRALMYEDLVLAESRGAPTDGVAAAKVLAERAMTAGIARFADAEELERFLARVAFAAERSRLRALGEQDVREALAGLAEGLRSFAELEAVARHGLIRALEASVGARRLDEVAPSRIRLPAGKHVPVTYEPGQSPWIAAKLQEFFGMTESPTAAGEPIVIRLLAPNNRPVQTTTDLAGFWRRLYPEIRRELSRRYPRHRWPEDPLEAQPGERVRRR